MDSIRDFLFSLVCVSMLCSVIIHLMHGLQMQTMGKIICGFVMTISLLRPLIDIKNIEFDFDLFSQSDEVQQAVAIGQDISLNAWADIIKLETEAYILDKARSLNADISVSVSVQNKDEPVPFSAEITGHLSPYARMQLERILENDLGITKENQQWNG